MQRSQRTAKSVWRSGPVQGAGSSPPAAGRTTPLDRPSTPQVRTGQSINTSTGTCRVAPSAARSKLEEHAIDLDRRDPGVDQLASPLLRLVLAFTRPRNASAAKATDNLPHDGSPRLHVPQA